MPFKTAVKIARYLDINLKEYCMNKEIEKRAQFVED